jgi:hypothetical protein
MVEVVGAVDDVRIIAVGHGIHNLVRSRSNGFSTRAGARNRFVVCLDNVGYDASLDVRKLYRVLADASAEERGMLRVIDESGEDYLYPKRLFAPIEVSPAIRRRFTSR